MADEAAAFVLHKPALMDELYCGLEDPEDVVRGRTADALEKVARERPDLLRAQIDGLIKTVESDPIPMVRWHIAMIFGHLACRGGTGGKDGTGAPGSTE
jgi:HEAT repeat protein